MVYQTAIVVEGGAMRGIFSAGALDVLLERNLAHFDLAIGASAGACNLASFLSAQWQRNLRCYRNIMTRPDFFSFRRAFQNDHYMDLDWLWDRIQQEEPLDEQAIEAWGTPLISVVTCVRTGNAHYLTHRAPHIHDELKAGCALPLLYRGPVRVRDLLVVDGGLTDPIPVQEAYRLGARRIVVIRSRPAHVIKRKGVFDLVMVRILSRNYPAVGTAVRRNPQRYKKAVEFLYSPPFDAKIIHLAPSEPLRTKRITQDRQVLYQDYMLGRKTAEEHLEEIHTLLKR